MASPTWISRFLPGTDDASRRNVAIDGTSGCGGAVNRTRVSVLCIWRVPRPTRRYSSWLRCKWSKNKGNHDVPIAFAADSSEQGAHYHPHQGNTEEDRPATCTRISLFSRRVLAITGGQEGARIRHFTLLWHEHHSGRTTDLLNNKSCGLN